MGLALFLTALEGNRSSAKLVSRDAFITNRGQCFEVVIEGLPPLSGQNAQLSEVPVRAAQDVSCQSGGESGAGESFCPVLLSSAAVRLRR